MTKSSRGGARIGAGRPPTDTKPVTTTMTGETKAGLLSINQTLSSAIEIIYKYYKDHEMSTILYRVKTTNASNQGYKMEKAEVSTTLYCGYDRDEAIRTYYQHKAEEKYPDYPGAYGNIVTIEKLDTTDIDVDDMPEMETVDIED